MHKLYTLAFALMSVAAQGAALDDLIAKNLAAHGGLEKMRAIASLRVEGHFVGDGLEIPFTDRIARPGSIRSEYTYQGLTAVTAYDGTEAWHIQPFGGRKDPDRIDAEESHGIIEGADIDGAFVDSAAKGIKLEYLGTEDVDGTLAHKIRVTRPYGDIQLIYLDPDHFLEIRVINQRTVRGVMREDETDFGDYESVDGVWMPFAIASGGRGSQQKNAAVIDKVTTNVPLDEAIFRFPAKKQ